MGAEEQGKAIVEEMKVAMEGKEMEAAVKQDKKVAGGEGLPWAEGGVEVCDDKVGDKVEEDDDDGTCEDEEEEVKWAKHYSSEQEILLVGEGDFSFSFSLATSFGSASNIVATSLDSYGDVTRKYSKAKSNLWNLQKMGATLLHGINATKMKLHVDLKMRKFDRIIFNFPHAGFKGKEDDIRLINLHKQLVYGFFRNASHMLRRDGEIHISHKTSFPFSHWKLEELASKSCLVLFQCADFKIEDYPGYDNKRGDGSRCDQPFPLGECCTYMFRIGKPLRGKPAASNVPTNVSASLPIAPDGHHLLLGTEEPELGCYTRYVSSWPNVEEVSFHGSSFPRRRKVVPSPLPSGPGYISSLEERIAGYLRKDIDSLLSVIFMDYMGDAQRLHGSISPEFSNAVEGFLRASCDVYMNEVPGRTIHGYISHLQELHRSSILRTEYLRMMLLRQAPEMGAGWRRRSLLRFCEPPLAASVWC